MSAPIQLYSLATPNGQKVSIALEETGLPYEAHTVDIRDGTQHQDWYHRINPNEKIPSIVDPDGPNGQEVTLMESGAILIYLARKADAFLPHEQPQHTNTLQWLFFQVGHIGPMFGQFGHFFAHGGSECSDPYPLERYTNETKRLLKVLDEQLAQHDYIAGDSYTIADMATFPWIGCLDWGYDAWQYLDVSAHQHVVSWHERCTSREAAQRGASVCPIE
jgi:GST-like protein